MAARALALQVGSPAYFSLQIEEETGLKYVRAQGVIAVAGDTCVLIVNSALCRILNLNVHRITHRAQKIEVGLIRMNQSQLLLSRPQAWRKLLEIDSEGLLNCPDVQKLLQEQQPEDLSGSDVEAVGHPYRPPQPAMGAQRVTTFAPETHYMFEDDAEDEEEAVAPVPFTDPMLQGMAQMGRYLQGGSTTQLNQGSGGVSPLVEPQSQLGVGWNLPTSSGTQVNPFTSSSAQAGLPFHSGNPYVTAMPHMQQRTLSAPQHPQPHPWGSPPQSSSSPMMGTGGYAMGPPPQLNSIPISPNMSLDEMMKMMILQQLQRNQVDSTNTTSRAFDRMDALQRELWDNPQSIISAYRAHVMFQMRVKPNQRWAWTDWWGTHPYGRFRSVGRLSYGLCELLEAFEVGQPQVAQAIAMQLVKSCHQFAIDGGSWHVAWPLSRLREPYYKEKFGGTSAELSAVSGYLKAESDLKSRIGPDSYYNSGSANEEPDNEEGSKEDSATPNAKAKGKGKRK